MMKTLTDLKKRIVVGTTLLTIHNPFRPELTDTIRTVVRVQGNGFWWTYPGDTRLVFTEYPKAVFFTRMDADTFRLGRNIGDGYVELRFVDPAAPVV